MSSPVTDPALPVAVDVRGRLLGPLRRVVEGQLGWQVVDGPGGPVPAVVRLADAAADDGAPLPTLLLVQAGDDPVASAEAARRLAPVATVGWPCEPGELHRQVTRAARARPSEAATWALRVGGVAGGVGTTTVAAAIAGLTAWRGTAALWVTADPHVLPGDAPAVDPSALAATDLWGRARPVPGVEGLRAVRLVDGHQVPADGPQLGDPRAEAVVLDGGVRADVDVLVGRVDARTRRACAETTAGTVVLVGGPPDRRLAEVLGPRRVVVLERSARVGRAGELGRLPAALPGRWLRPLTVLAPQR